MSPTPIIVVLALLFVQAGPPAEAPDHSDEPTWTAGTPDAIKKAWRAWDADRDVQVQTLRQRADELEADIASAADAKVVEALPEAFRRRVRGDEVFYLVQSEDAREALVQELRSQVNAATSEADKLAETNDVDLESPPLPPEEGHPYRLTRFKVLQVTGPESAIIQLDETITMRVPDGNRVRTARERVKVDLWIEGVSTAGWVDGRFQTSDDGPAVWANSAQRYETTIGSTRSIQKVSAFNLSDFIEAD